MLLDQKLTGLKGKTVQGWGGSGSVNAHAGSPVGDFLQALQQSKSPPKARSMLRSEAVHQERP